VRGHFRLWLFWWLLDATVTETVKSDDDDTKIARLCVGVSSWTDGIQLSIQGSVMLIAFEGPIAAGKTTLATLYSEYSGGTLILEEFEKNEFLADFYADKPRWSLPMQLSFALDRNTQWRRFEAQQSTLLIADYSPLKDMIFARTLMGGRELRLFERAVGAVQHENLPADLIVHLDATDEVLLNRIASRGRPYERQIDPAYQNQLRAAYALQLKQSEAPDTLWFDTTELDLGSRAQLSAVYTAIDAARQSLKLKRVTSLRKP
jgi:deoxyguanosine kinase